MKKNYGACILAFLCIVVRLYAQEQPASWQPLTDFQKRISPQTIGQYPLLQPIRLFAGKIGGTPEESKWAFIFKTKFMENSKESSCVAAQMDNAFFSSKFSILEGMFHPDGENSDIWASNSEVYEVTSSHINKRGWAYQYKSQDGTIAWSWQNDYPQWVLHTINVNNTEKSWIIPKELKPESSQQEALIFLEDQTPVFVVTDSNYKRYLMRGEEILASESIFKNVGTFNGKRKLWYVFDRNGESFLQIGDRCWGPYHPILMDSVTVTDNGDFAFVMVGASGHEPVWNNNVLPARPKVLDIALSQDGKHLLFSAKKGNGVVISDGTNDSEEFLEIPALGFNADGTALWYTVRVHTMSTFVVLGDQNVGPFINVYYTSTVPDSYALSFVAKTSAGSYLVYGAQHFGPFESISPSSLYNGEKLWKVRFPNEKQDRLLHPNGKWSEPFELFAPGLNGAILYRDNSIGVFKY